ncbi:hypothetical protein RN001_013533 [Aquatica leii]|uniref:Cytochrome P450 n=1 Tax=Aquatica leii TaxID=1421715 RepID=A0AAN7QDA4_9COLE|nr:hypothetical protein RN001_013533 [Aquatica leii]
MYMIILAFTCALFWLLVIWRFNHWKRKGVPQLDVWTALVNNFKGILQYVSVADNVTQIHCAFPETRYTGAYQFLSPILFIRDPELIKQIMIKDFEHFVDHRQIMTEECEPLWGKNLLSLKGDKWKFMRATLSPSFTSSKMKAMFEFMSECAYNFVRHFEGESKTITVELKDFFTRYTNDVIASAAFGLSCNSVKERDNEFYEMVKEATNLTGFLTNLKFLSVMISPTLSKILGVHLFDNKITTFFRRLVKENIESREKSGIVRMDMIHLLMEARKGELKHDEEFEHKSESFTVVQEHQKNKTQYDSKLLTDDDLTAQALIFLLAGFDTVSALICFASYELAIDPIIQNKLQDEIDTTLQECKGRVTYDALMKMEYMDMVVSETYCCCLGWPATGVTDRVCVKPYTIEPVKEGEKPVHIKKGELIWVPIYAIHRDENLYPEPERFNPERFSHENKSSIRSYTYLPFGLGPRACIGNRFALLEAKTLLFYVLSKFDIVVVDKSVIPLKISPKQFTLTAEHGFWFGFKPRVANVK